MKTLAVLAIAVAVSLPALGAVTGTVVDASGSPVANVRIDAYRPVQQYQAMVMFAKLLGATPLASTRTDAKGAFSIDLAGRGVADIHATADGYAPADVFAAYDDATTITLRKAADVAGSVTANGKPVANAVVIAIAAEGFPLAVKTDAQGVFHLPDAKSWSQFTIAMHPDFAPAAHPPADLSFVLEAGRSVKGKVIDEKGAGVSGAEISIDGLPYGKSGDDGTFEAKHVPQRSAQISARTATAAATMRMPSGTPTLKLQRVSRVTGVIRDAAKQPLAGIAVAAAGGEQSGYDLAYTDSKGMYSIALPRGRFQVSPQGFGVYAIDDAEVDGRNGDVRQDFEAKREQYVTGIVKLRDGTPVAGAEIGLRGDMSAVGMQMQSPAWMMGVRTSADGRFRVSRSGQTKFTVVAIKRGLPVAESTTLTESSADRGVTITIPEGIAITGKVLDADHHPLAGVAIDPILGYGGESVPMTRSDDPAAAWATTKDDGTFTGQLSRGSTALNFAKKGFVAAQQMVEVAPGMNSLEVTLARGGSLHGIVVNKDGSPAPEIPVIAGEHYAMSGADGKFSIDDVEPGDYVLQFGRTGGQQKNVRVPSDDIRLVLGATRQIAGRVTDSANGAPIEQFTVWVRSENDRTMPEPVSSPTGEFNVEAPEGKVTLNVSAPGYATAKNVAVGDSAIAVTLSRGRTIRGRVTDSAGQPLGEVSVSTSSGRSDDFIAPDQSPQTAGDGAYELAGIDFDDDVTLSFQKQGYVQEQRKVRAARDDAKVDVVLRSGIVVTGRVVDAGGNGVADASVSASSASHGAGYDSAETDNTGAFRFAGLAPGRYEFSAEVNEPALKGALKDVDIEKLHEITIRVDKHPTALITGHVTGLDSASIIRMVTASNEQQDSATAMIDATGNFRIEAPAGLVKVSAQMTSRRGSRQTAPVSVDAPAGVERRVDLAFVDQVKVRGTVTRSGAPAAGVRVVFGSSYSNAAMTTATADGAYETLIDPGDYDVALYDGNNQIPFSRHVTIASDSQIDLRVDTSSIRITVIDAETSQPLDGATLNLMHGSGTHSVGTATTGPDGSASVEVPRENALTVTASRRGYANAVADIAEGSSAPMVLRLARSAGAIVRLVDRRDGRTLSGYVIARDDAGRLLASSYEEEADGTVTLPLPAGRYQFSGSAEGYGSQTVAGEAGATEVKIALPRGGGIALRSNTDLHGTARLIQPDGREYVRCWCNGIATIDINGRVTIVDRISPGPYTLEVTLTGAKPRTIPVTVVEGQTLPVPID